MMNFNNLVRNKRFLLLIVFLSLALIMVNQIVLKLMVLGTIASLMYVIVGGYLVGTALFEEEQLVVRLSLGALLLLSFMSFLSWIVVIFNFHIGVFEAGGILLATSLFLVIVMHGRAIKEKMPSFPRLFSKKNPEEK